MPSKGAGDLIKLPTPFDVVRRFIFKLRSKLCPRTEYRNIIHQSMFHFLVASQTNPNAMEFRSSLFIFEFSTRRGMERRAANKTNAASCFSFFIIFAESEFSMEPNGGEVICICGAPRSFPHVNAHPGRSEPKFG